MLIIHILKHLPKVPFFRFIRGGWGPSIFQEKNASSQINRNLQIFRNYFKLKHHFEIFHTAQTVKLWITWYIIEPEATTRIRVSCAPKPLQFSSILKKGLSYTINYLNLCYFLLVICSKSKNNYFLDKNFLYIKPIKNGNVGHVSCNSLHKTAPSIK